MALDIIISATAFLLYLQTGFFVFWKNRKAPVNRWFFLMSVYLAMLSVFLTLAYSTMKNELGFSIVLRISWSLIPAFLFRLHAFLTGVPTRKNVQDSWFIAYFFMGSLIGLFMLSAMISIDAERLPQLNEWFWMRLVSHYLFYVLMLANLAAIIYQYIHWRKQIAWRKERNEFSHVTYSFIILSSVVFLIQIISPGSHMATLLKMPHIFLLPWFLLIAFGFVRYKFSPPDPARAASIVLNDLQQLLLFCNENLRLKRMNAYARQVLKQERNDEKNLEIQHIFNDYQKAIKLFEKASSTGHSGPEETLLATTDGELIPFSISCTVLTDKFGDTYGVAFYGEDLSEVYALRDEIRKREEIEASLRNISDDLEAEAIKRSHEIRHSLEAAEKKLIERIKAEELIKTEIAEIEVMMGEIHSRNKKNLDILLSILQKSSNHNFTRQELQQMQSLYHRINSILIANTQILSHDNYGMVRFKSFLELLVDSYLDASDTPAEIMIQADDELLWIDQALPLALVANELISNAFRHAFTGFVPHDAFIKIKYWHENKILCKLAVSDNGSGISGAPVISKPGYNGLHLAQLLAKDQLNGSIIFNQQQKGTSIVVSIPLEQLRQGHIGHAS